MGSHLPASDPGSVAAIPDGFLDDCEFATATVAAVPALAALPGWVPFDSFNLNEDVPGSVAAPAKALAYPWSHFVGGHIGRLGTRADMLVYQEYIADLVDSVRTALNTVDPTPFFAKYTGVLAAADV